MSYAQSRMNQTQALELGVALGRIGVTMPDARALVRLSNRVHRLAEQHCNGAPEWIRYLKAAPGDKESPAEKWENKVYAALEAAERKAEEIVGHYPGLKIEHQRDPRGAPFTIRYRKGARKNLIAVIL